MTRIKDMPASDRLDRTPAPDPWTRPAPSPGELFPLWLLVVMALAFAALGGAVGMVVIGGGW